MKANEIGMKILPHLIAAARQKTTITYGELAERIGINPWPIRHGLGYVRDEICDPRNLPLLNVLCVNKDTGKPGSGWIPERLLPVDKDEEEVWVKHLQAVWKYPNWVKLLRELGLK